jgi:hypothetical protein
MFDQIGGSTVPATHGSAFRSNRAAIRRREAREYPKLAGEYSSQKTGEELGRRGRLATLVGALLMSGIVFGGVEVFGRLWANIGMVR